MKRIPMPSWDEAPDWAKVLYRDTYGAWAWADSFPYPARTARASEDVFEYPTLTLYDSNFTVQLRPGGQDEQQ